MGMDTIYAEKETKNHSDTQEKLDPSCSTREQCGAQRTWGKQDRRRPLSNSFSWGGKSRAGSECTSFSDWMVCWEHPFESWVYLSSRRPLPMQHQWYCSHSARQISSCLLLKSSKLPQCMTAESGALEESKRSWGHHNSKERRECVGKLLVLKHWS